MLRWINLRLYNCWWSILCAFTVLSAGTWAMFSLENKSKVNDILYVMTLQFKIWKETRTSIKTLKHVSYCQIRPINDCLPLRLRSYHFTTKILNCSRVSTLCVWGGGGVSDFSPAMDVIYWFSLPTIWPSHLSLPPPYSTYYDVLYSCSARSPPCTHATLAQALM